MWYGICYWKIGIGKYVFKVHYRCQKKKKKRTYTSAFVNAGIGIAYASAFKSVGIGLLNYIDLRPIPALFSKLE